MKRRYLRKEIQDALVAATAIIAIILFTISDIETMGLVPFLVIFGLCIMLYVNVKVLSKWGKMERYYGKEE